MISLNVILSMETSLPKYGDDQDTYIKHNNTLEFTMDYDSGYVSHNQESNLDSSSESLNEKIARCTSDKPIYLSEDALLEIPEINKCHNLSIEIDKEDYEETRQLFNSPSTENGTILTNSTESHEMDYSGFVEASDESDIEIPNINQIIINNLDKMEIPNTENQKHTNEKFFEETCCSDSNEEYFKGFPSNMCSTTAFHNITNTLITDDPKKKLTLIFSKCDKENVYSVKRKYRSMTPDKNMTPEKIPSPRKLEQRQSEQSQYKLNDLIKSSDITDHISKDMGSDIGDVSHQFEKSVNNSFTWDESESSLVTNKQNITSSTSEEKHKTNDSSLLSECLKNFSEACLVNENMYVENEIKDTKVEAQEINFTESFKLDREGIQDDCSKQVDAITLVTSDVEIENIDLCYEPEKKMHKHLLKQNENVGYFPVVSMEMNTSDPTVQAPLSYPDTQGLIINNISSNSGSCTNNLMNKENEHKNSSAELSEPNTSTDALKSRKFSNPNKSTDGSKSTEISKPNRSTDALKSREFSNSNTSTDGSKSTEISKPNTSTEALSKKLDNEIILFENISNTPRKKIRNILDPNLSPDLFEDDEIVENTQISQLPTYIAEERYIIKKDRAILRRAQNNLKGVIPPHSMTVLNISVNEMLDKIEHNASYFWQKDEVNQNESVSDKNSSLNSDSSIKDDVSKSLLITCSIEEARKKEFTDILGDRCHGLYFNCSKLSEEFEDLCIKYCQRYVGAETQSSCTIFESNCSSPVKRKQIKQRWPAKSPGRRLSHLAKRRITFSSANLQTNSSFAGSRARQILVDAKKLELLNRRKSPRKTPKKTPGKSPRIKTRTPSSSAKKKLALRFRKVTGEIEKTVSIATDLPSKRALFQSPDRDKNSSLFLPSTSGVSAFPTDNQKPSTKRALFLSPSKKPSRNSPFKRSPFRRLDLGEERKRKRSDSEDFHPSKLSRSLSMDIRPSGSEIKPLNRTRSDLNISLVGELSAVHKKKLQWAVYEALRSQSITATHPQFKLYASILARVTRRFLPNSNSSAARTEGSTSDRMLRIARYHVYAVLKGKSVDEIYNEYVKSRIRNAKPQGYVGLEEYNIDRRQPLQNSSSLNKTVDESLQRKMSGNFKPGVASENKIDRIRKVINFGDDNS